MTGAAAAQTLLGVQWRQLTVVLVDSAGSVAQRFTGVVSAAPV